MIKHYVFVGNDVVQLRGPRKAIEKFMKSIPYWSLLSSYCLDCGKHGPYNVVCKNCKSTNMIRVHKAPPVEPMEKVS